MAAQVARLQHVLADGALKGLGHVADVRAQVQTTPGRARRLDPFEDEVGGEAVRIGGRGLGETANAAAPAWVLTIMGQKARVPGMLSRMRQRLSRTARHGVAATIPSALIASWYPPPKSAGTGKGRPVKNSPARMRPADPAHAGG